MTSVNMKDLLESGVHYGHQTRRWNPKMKQYIFGERNGIHIIDLQQTVKMFKKALDFTESVTARRGHVLFVGTKRLAKDIVADEARRSGMYFMNHRWLGGTLTNFHTIRQSIHRLKRFEKMKQDGVLGKLTKKEALGFEREMEKLELVLGGIKDMPGLPRAVFVVDAHKEQIAVAEAQKLGIPIIAITDTNSDPTGIDYPIPGNDDGYKAVSLIVKSIADACMSGKAKSKDMKIEDEKSHVSEGSFRDDQGHRVKVEKKRKDEAPAGETDSGTTYEN